MSREANFPVARLVGLPEYTPRQIWWRNWARQAAVAAVLRHHPQAGGVEVLLIKRSEHPLDPWSGHMAFPGGRRDPGDRRIYQTAVRELHEEIGLDIETTGRHFGRLSDIMARPIRWRRRPLIVSPFVFALEQPPPRYRLDPAEVDEMVWVPLSFLADHANRQKMDWQRGRVKVKLPCYRYKGYLIWGLTLRMLDELTAITFP